MSSVQARVRLQPDVHPVFVRAQKLPFALRDSVEKELDELERHGIIRKVDSARWATPIVPVRKQGNKVRLCGDYKITVNPRIVRANGWWGQIHKNRLNQSLFTVRSTSI